MTLIYVFFASILASSSNFCLRKNLEKQKSSEGYLTLYFIFSFVISFFLKEVHLESFSFVMSSVGIVAGMLNFLMMVLLARSVKTGPSGLTFAFQNSASTVPSLMLFFIFGSSFGFGINLPSLFGFGLIILGLFLSSLKQNDFSFSHRRISFKWFLLITFVFLLQGIILSIIQWRCLFFTDHFQTHVLIPWKCANEEDSWFMPGFFFFPAILQTLIFAFTEKRWVSKRELFLGIAGGCLNGAATFFLLLATSMANRGEKIILFPFFAVSVIFFCNLWGQKFYKERIYWPGIILCFLGIFISFLKN